MKTTITAQIVLLILGVLGVYGITLSVHLAMSFFFGAAAMALNLVLLTTGFQGLLNKKSVAYPTALVVFKYPILIGLILLLFREFHLSPVYFAMGLGTLTFSIFAEPVRVWWARNKSETEEP